MAMWTSGPRRNICNLVDWETLKKYWFKPNFTTK